MAVLPRSKDPGSDSEQDRCIPCKDRKANKACSSYLKISHWPSPSSGPLSTYFPTRSWTRWGGKGDSLRIASLPQSRVQILLHGFAAWSTGSGLDSSEFFMVRFTLCRSLKLCVPYKTKHVATQAAGKPIRKQQSSFLPCTLGQVPFLLLHTSLALWIERVEERIHPKEKPGRRKTALLGSQLPCQGHHDLVFLHRHVVWQTGLQPPTAVIASPLQEKAQLPDLRI